MIVKAIERIGNLVRIIDQTSLPEKVIFRELSDYRDIISAIKHLEIRGAPAIGIAAAYALPIAVEHQNGFSEIKKISEEIKNARPTAVNLAWAVDRMLSKLDKASIHDQDEALQLLWEEAEKIHQEDRQMCNQIGEFGNSLIPDSATILTHCNAGALATGGIGTALGVIYTAQKSGKKLKVYADETRPLLQGARLTAWELTEAQIDVSLICDNTAGFLMSQGGIDCVIVGADRIAANGDTANKIGTYSLAVLADYHQIPFYVAAPRSTFDKQCNSGKEIIIEERSADEVTEGFGRRTAPQDILVYSPAFDITPNNLITTFITNTGLQPGGRGK